MNREKLLRLKRENPGKFLEVLPHALVCAFADWLIKAAPAYGIPYALQGLIMSNSKKANMIEHDRLDLKKLLLGGAIFLAGNYVYKRIRGGERRAKGS
ncbi:MAG: hypothetical protein K6T73_01155 [Candidatus Bathyarchaeota archaeon]|nr:hypothetical protein [Candidatus Bathyarchaeota archaeon]